MNKLAFLPCLAALVCVSSFALADEEKPLVDKDGKPLTAEQKACIDDNAPQPMLDENGKPMMDKDGKPMMQPPPARLFDRKGTFVIGAERLFGFTSTSTKTSQGAADLTEKRSQFGFLWSSPETIYSIPRLGADYMLTDHFSIGGTLGIATSSGTNDAGGKTTDAPSQTAILVAPRAGFVFGSGAIALWLRGGFTFYSLSQKTTIEATPTTPGSTTKLNSTGLAFNLEPMIVISPYKHVGLYLAGNLDLAITGSQDGGASGSNTQKINNFGATSGLLTWF